MQLQTYAFLSFTTMASVHAIANLRWDQVDFEKEFVLMLLRKKEK